MLNLIHNEAFQTNGINQGLCQLPWPGVFVRTIYCVVGNVVK